ncbi:MAG TPA: signal peptide peptidase SppA [Gammaproteobacteria bacterium]
MTRQTESPFRQMLSVLDTARSVVLNILFVMFMVFVLLIFAAAAGLFAKQEPMQIAEGSALRVAPEGVLVEEYSGEAVERAINEALGDGVPEVRLRDLTASIDAAANDGRIAALVLDLDSLFGGGPAMYQDLAAAVERFRASGKKVVAVGDSYMQGPYYVAAHADEILMHPMGVVFVSGYGIYRNYYKEALDYLDAEWNVFHAGEYKSYGEPFTRTGMSDEARAANKAFLEDLWSFYRAGVEAARELEQGALQTYVQSLGGDADGDFAQAAVDFGLVDALMPRDEMNLHIAAMVGEGNGGLGFSHIDYRPYVEQVRMQKQLRAASQPQVAVLVAEGPIVAGDQPPGVIAAERMVREIRELRDNENVHAVVLRVNSSGGSAFASEIIQRELELLQGAGKPLVVSMGAVAASGGYWISMTADEIWAQPTTITGSIGVVAMFPTFEGTLNKYGITTDGVGTTPISGAFRLDRSMGPEIKQAMQASVDHLYDVFINEVAANRGLEVATVDEVGRGRVWSGSDALEHGLVDSLGGLQQAVEAAAELASLEEYAVVYREPSLSVFDRMLIDMFQTAAPRLASGNGIETSVMRLPLVRQLAAELERMRHFNDPRGVYALCLCNLPF